MVARPTLLEMLDLSHNQLASFPRVWPQLRHLQTLDVSHNPIPSIVQGECLDKSYQPPAYPVTTLHSNRPCPQVIWMV